MGGTGNHTTIFEPLIIEDPETLSWASEADVVVVGFGGAGAAAAIQARELGGSVIVLDRFGGGGATAFSGGVFYAGGTRLQEQAGFPDTANNMYDYLSQEESAVSPATLQQFCESSNADFEWLRGQGVPFDSKVYEEKTAYPPDGYFLYYSGNEKVPSYMQRARPAPRGHRTVGTGYTGYAYFAPLRVSALAKGVHLMPHSPVRRLVIDRAGAVIGVEAQDLPRAVWNQHEAIYKKVNPMRAFAGTKHEKAIADAAEFEQRYSGRKLIRARGGVVLATGGFVYSLDKLRQHAPLFSKMVKALVRIGSMGCDGSGIDLGRSAGGHAALMDEIFAARSIAPPAGFVHGILVDSTGRRFINEDAYTGFVGGAIAKLPNEGKAWLILDRDSFLDALKQCLFPGKGLYLYTLPSLLNVLIGGTKRAASLAALAEKCRMDGSVLMSNVEANNAFARGSASDPLGKAPENSRPIVMPPFYAINMDLGNKFATTLVFTLGGLVVDENSGEVKREDGTRIRGLYAAGRAAVGLCSKGYLSGMSLADTVFSGRRAARHVIDCIGVADR